MNEEGPVASQPRSWLLILCGWLTAFASLGILLLLFATPAGAFLLWEFPAHPWLNSVRGVVFDALLVLLAVVPLMVASVPGTRWFAALSVRKRVVIRTAWVLWLLAGLPGWLAVRPGLTTVDDAPGLGLLIIFAAPVLGVVLVATVVAVGVTLAIRRWRTSRERQDRSTLGC